MRIARAMRIAVPSPRLRGEGGVVSQRREQGEGESPRDVVLMVPLTQFECAERSESPSPRKRGEGTAMTTAPAASTAPQTVGYPWDSFLRFHRANSHFPPPL
jgi:hypothetical protein